MGYKTSSTTTDGFKVGDMLYGKNNFSAKVIAVNPSNGAIDIQVTSSHPGTYYYYFSNPYRSTVRKEPDQWMRLPSDKKLKNIDRDTYVQFKVVKDTTQSKDYSWCSWWGNLYGNDLTYGDPPYGHFYITGSVNETYPSKDLPEWEWKDYFDVPSGWSRVPGTYRWCETNGTYYGWRKESNYGGCWNSYARRFTMRFALTSSCSTESGHIAISNFKVTTTTKTYIARPIDCYLDRASFDCSSYENISNLKKGTSDKIKLKPYPSVNKISISGALKDTLYIAWTSIEDAEDPNLDYGDKIKNEYTSIKLTKVDKDGNTTTKTLSNNRPYLMTSTELDVGTYTLDVTARFDGKDSQKTSNKFIIEVEDDADAIIPIIIDKSNPAKIKYSDIFNVSVYPHTPILDRNAMNTGANAGQFDKHEYKATYTYMVNNKVQECKVPFDIVNGNKEFKLSGHYEISCTATRKSNRKCKTIKVQFDIDTIPPKRPIIQINDDYYDGPFNKDESAKKTYITSAIPKILPPKGEFNNCNSIINEIRIYYKRYSNTDFREIRYRYRTKKLPSVSGIDLSNISITELPYVINTIGIYKIVARRLKFVGDTILKSEDSVAIFGVKRKFNSNIELITYEIDRNYQNESIVNYRALDKDEEGRFKGYKVEARITYDTSLSSNNEAGMYFLDTGQSIKDYEGMYSTIKKLYRINNGDWQYYNSVANWNVKYNDTGEIGKTTYDDKGIFIYENCTISAKTIDDDNFESDTTTVKVTSIDRKTVPEKLELETIDGPLDTGTIFTDTILSISDFIPTN